VRPLSAREQKLLALALLVGAIALVWLAIVQPVADGFSARAAEREQLTQTWRRNDRLIAAMPAWRAASEQQSRTADRFSINAPSGGLAAEALKTRIQQLAADEGFNVTGVEELSDQAKPGEVRVRADGELTLAQLCDSLRRLETEGAFVIVDFISISADRAVASGREAPLDVRLELSAAYRPPHGRGL
jgi:general secretion pathway protein M